MKGETGVAEKMCNAYTYWNITQVKKKKKISFVQVIYVGVMSVYKQGSFSEAWPFTAKDGEKVHLNVKHMIVKKDISVGLAIFYKTHSKLVLCLTAVRAVPCLFDL